MWIYIVEEPAGEGYIQRLYIYNFLNIVVCLRSLFLAVRGDGRSVVGTCMNENGNFTVSFQLLLLMTIILGLKNAYGVHPLLYFKLSALLKFYLLGGKVPI